MFTLTNIVHAADKPGKHILKTNSLHVYIYVNKCTQYLFM